MLELEVPAEPEPPPVPGPPVEPWPVPPAPLLPEPEPVPLGAPAAPGAAPGVPAGRVVGLPTRSTVPEEPLAVLPAPGMPVAEFRLASDLALSGVPVPPLRLVLLSRSHPARAAPPIARAAKVVHVIALRIGSLRETRV